LPHLHEPSYLVLADDDVAYRSDFLERLVEAQRANSRASFSFYTYKIHSLTVGQGCDGFSFWTPNLAGVGTFFDRHVEETQVRLHDDLWISFFLASRGIPVRSLQSRLDGTLIYHQVHEVNALRQLTGTYAREALNREGLRLLLKSASMPVARKWRILVSLLIGRLKSRAKEAVR
jgi:hypothetical protein